MNTIPLTLTEAACCIINEPDPNAKVELTRSFAASWTSRLAADIGTHFPPDRPARSDLPKLKHPSDMPRRRKIGIQGKRAFIHSINHIELNAIDLPWDIIFRFVHEDLPTNFYNDWVRQALNEAEHYAMLVTWLNSLEATYGDLAAHDGLWEAVDKTVGDLISRLAVVPMILEERGLDTTPTAVQRFKNVGDTETTAILDQIGKEEIAHVAAGERWFEFV